MGVRIPTVVASLLLMGAGSTYVESSVVKGLKFLARHQAEDGSWGARRSSCMCPRGTWASWKTPQFLKVDPVIREQVRVLMERLDHESIEERDQALNDLARIGIPAGPQLEAAAASGTDELSLRAGDALIRIIGEPADLELTALAVLAIMGAGYAPNSRDAFSGICFGEVVRKGLLWIVSTLENVGPIDEGNARVRIVATLAMTEAWSLTELEEWKEASLKALEGFDAFVSKDVRTLAWKGLLVRSIEVGKLPTPGLGLRELSEILEGQAGDLAFSSSFLLRAWSKGATDSARQGNLLNLHTVSTDPETAWFAAMAGWRWNSVAPSLWSTRSGDFLRALNDVEIQDPRRCECGSWDGDGLKGRLRNSALRLLTLEACYRYTASMAAGD